ncbi:MAG: N-acetyltransferase [Ilumatobacteraceae bacterium]
MLRAWVPDDVPFLWDMLLTAIHVPDGHEPPPKSILDDPAIAHYLAGFGTLEGDDAVVACDQDGRRLGAAWVRRLPPDDGGFGFVGADIPELSMAVLPEHRGRGLGRAMLEVLLASHPVMSLSVATDNAVAVRLYKSLGFAEVRPDGTSTTMVRR